MLHSWDASSIIYKLARERGGNTSHYMYLKRELVYITSDSCCSISRAALIARISSYFASSLESVSVNSVCVLYKRILFEQSLYCS